MTESTASTSRLTYVQIWQSITEAVADVRTLAATAANNASQDLLPLLREKIGQRVDRLSAELGLYLDEGPAQKLLLPLVLLCDELVLIKLPEPKHEAWPLLQEAWFHINDGGEKFFDLIDQTSKEQQPSELLLETLYYCLGQGFLGRYMNKELRKLNPNDTAKVQHYKDILAKRIQLAPRKSQTPDPYRRAERKLREAQAETTAGSPGAHMPLIAPLVLYAATFLFICALPFLFIFLSNVQLRTPAQTLSARHSQQDSEGEDVQDDEEAEPAPADTARTTAPTPEGN